MTAPEGAAFIKDQRVGYFIPSLSKHTQAALVPVNPQNIF
jgi:hypothetical protein